jgi:hypothetical protein
MAKLLKVKLVASNEVETTRKAGEMLKNLNIEVETLPPDRVFEERFELPFLETEDGHRYFGIQGIGRFAEGCSKLR